MRKILGFLFLLAGCQNPSTELPYLGINAPDENGKMVYHSIDHFSFTNQDGQTVTNEDFKNKIYVSDFFFTSCPTICPVMKTQMLRLYEHYKGNPEIAFLSHSIDPAHDSVEVLKKYKTRLGVEGPQWQFITGDQEQIYEMAQKSYMVSALEDSTAVDEGGFVHSGAFVLVDKNRHIRGVFDGTKEKEVDKLMDAIDVLLKK